MSKNLSPPDPEGGEAIDRIEEVRSVPINQSYQKVAGIDANLDWRLKTGRMGDYRFSLAWSHTLTSERQVVATDPIEEDWRDDPSNLDYRSRIRAGLDWRLGDWRAALFATRYGTLPKWEAGAGRGGVHIRWNANIGKQITDRMSLRFYVNNLFDNIHPHDETNSDFPYFYDRYSPVGREVAMQMEYNFD